MQVCVACRSEQLPIGIYGAFTFTCVENLEFHDLVCSRNRSADMKISHARAVTCALIAIAVAGVTSDRLAAQSGSKGYRLTKTIAVGGDEGWDYLTVDSAARRVYVSHGSRVVVLDADNNSVIGEIPDTQGVHGIAVAADAGRGFTSNGRANTVTIFDLKTLKSLATVNVGKNPDAIIYDPATRRVFTMNGGSQDATAINAADGAVAGTLALGGKPEFAVA